MDEPTKSIGSLQKIVNSSSLCFCFTAFFPKSSFFSQFVALSPNYCASTQSFIFCIFHGQDLIFLYITSICKVCCVFKLNKNLPPYLFVFKKHLKLITLCTAFLALCLSLYYFFHQYQSFVIFFLGFW